jgi:hypothetical protein
VHPAGGEGVHSVPEVVWGLTSTWMRDERVVGRGTGMWRVRYVKSW